LTNPQYLYWVSETKACLLWITGYSGSGKTTLSAFLSEYLSQSQPSTSFRPTVCFFFCDEKIETQRDGKAILRSLIFQILGRRRKLIRHVKSAYDIQGSHLVENFNELWRIFTAVARDKRMGPLHVIIDAIDECEEISRNRFLEAVSTLVGKAQSADSSDAPPVKFLLTSRPLLGRRYTTHHLQIEDVHSVEDDLRLVIHTKIEGIARRMNWKPETRKFLEQTLYAKSDQTFLWVKLVLRILEKSYLASQKDIQRVINEIPQGLSAIYERFLQSISAEYQVIASKLLHFLVGSLRPLTLEELRVLLALQDHHETIAAVEEDSQPNIRETLEGILGPMVRISDSRVSLVHQSAKEYLQALSTQESNPLCAVFGVDTHKASMLLAQTCIAYLQLHDFKDDIFSIYQLSAEESPISPVAHTQDLDNTNVFTDPYDIGEVTILRDPEVVESEACKIIAERYSLFDYSAMHWARNFSSCNGTCPQTLVESALAISDSYEIAKIGWFRYYWFYAGVGSEYPRDFTPFVIACFFCHLASIKSLLDGGLQQDQDALGSGLYWASRMGHRDVVDYLLRYCVAPDSKTVNGQTPLTAAAEFDHVQVVELLLQADATDVNYRNYRGRTPLSFAAANGHYEVVRRLLDHQRVQPEIPDYDKRTPIFWAIDGKHLNILNMLATDERIDINHVDKQGRTALSSAAAEGESELVKYLLTFRDLDVQHKDANGRDAISWAAGNGHLHTLSILVRSKRIEMSRKDNKGRNAISWACSGGHHTVVEYLIKHDPAGVDEEDVDGWTPLAWALNKDAPKTVGALLASGLVNVNRRDAIDRTPLAWAAGYGYVDIVRMLMNVEGIEMDGAALSQATIYGHTDVVRALQGLET
jgi:ankyrin repeat domain-containing protein 50